MPTSRMNRAPKLLPLLLERTPLKDAEFFLVDVGASGGIDERWKVFGDNLRAVGFDPLVAEIERLNREPHSPKVAYEAAYVTCRDPDPRLHLALRSPQTSGVRNDFCLQRNSSWQFTTLLGMDYHKEVFNKGQQIKYADRRLILDDYFGADERRKVDFLKTDTDGYDLEALLGARDLLAKGRIVGLSVEVFFQGPLLPHANVFSNVDAYLRELGFSLFDLDVNRYSRAALPAEFCWALPAQTRSGQVVGGEAVYFRDLGRADFETQWPFEPNEIIVLKQAGLYDLFGLPDCAAELILKYADRFDSLANPDRLLNALTPALHGETLTYEEYKKRFEKDPRSFFSLEERRQCERRKRHEATLLLERTPLGEAEFFLVDVGASGGIDALWKVFGPHLRAVGFDPLIAEVERLNRECPAPGIIYEAAYVTCQDADPRLPTAWTQAGVKGIRNDLSFPRSSAFRAAALLNLEYSKDVFNRGEEIRLAERRIVLDDYFTKEDRKRVDFIKSDTDGLDYEVLLGAQRLLAEERVLGLSVEASFQGPALAQASFFSSLDRYLRERGFSLFDLDLNRYSRAALPGEFCGRMPAQTKQGQVVWGEAIYFRDLGHADYERMWDFAPRETDVLKLVALFELFGLPDCAAELILKYADRFDSFANPDPFLDALTPAFRGEEFGYKEYKDRFEKDPRSFFPLEEHRQSERMRRHEAKNRTLARRIRKGLKSALGFEKKKKRSGR